MKKLLFLALLLSVPGCLQSTDPNSTGSDPYSNLSEFEEDTAFIPESTGEEKSIDIPITSAPQDNSAPYEVAEDGIGHSGGESQVMMQCFHKGGDFAQVRLQAWKAQVNGPHHVALYPTEKNDQGVFGIGKYSYPVGQCKILILRWSTVTLKIDTKETLADTDQYLATLELTHVTPHLKELLLCRLAPQMLSGFHDSIRRAEKHKLNEAPEFYSGSPEEAKDSRAGFWTAGQIPYVISPSVSNDTFVRAAITEIETKTPIRFIEKNIYAPKSLPKSYLHFLRSDVTDSGSFIGQLGGPQPLFVASSATTTNILHELGHAIGLRHLTEREDAAEHLELFPQNMVPRMAKFFGRTTDTRIKAFSNLPSGFFDWNSIMLYGPFAFSINGRPTSRPKSISFDEMLRRSSERGLSEGDVRSIGDIVSASSCVGNAYQYEMKDPSSSRFELRIIHLLGVTPKSASPIPIIISPTEKPLILNIDAESSQETVPIKIIQYRGSTLHTIIHSNNVEISNRIDPAIRVIKNQNIPSSISLSYFWERDRWVPAPAYLSFLRDVRQVVRELVVDAPLVERSFQTCLMGRSIVFHIPNPTHHTFSEPF